MRRQQAKGVSLVEGILTLFLFAVVLSAVGSLLSDSSKLLRRADELSWTNRASDWFNQVELNARNAVSLSPAPGGTSNELRFQVRDLSSADFLPASPISTWSVDQASLKVEMVYKITGPRLSESRTPNAAATTTVELGLADKFTVERKSNGNLVLTLEKGQESLRREIVLSTIDSQAGPL